MVDNGRALGLTDARSQKRPGPRWRIAAARSGSSLGLPASLPRRDCEMKLKFLAGYEA